MFKLYLLSLHCCPATLLHYYEGPFITANRHISLTMAHLHQFSH